MGSFNKDLSLTARGNWQPKSIGEGALDQTEALIVEEQGTVVHATSLAATQLGYSDAAELIGRPVADFRVTFGLKPAEAGGEQLCRQYGIRKNGSLLRLCESISTFAVRGHRLVIRASHPLTADREDSHWERARQWSAPSVGERDLIWVLGPDQTCRYVNRNWLEFTGQTLAEALGNNLLATVHPEDAAQHSNHLELAFANQKSFRMEYRMRRRDGQYRWMLSTGFPHHLSDGTFAGFSGSCADISDVKTMRADLRRLEGEMSAVLDNSPEVIFLKDLEGRYLRINRRFEEMAHTSRQETLHKTDRDVFPADANPGAFRRAVSKPGTVPEEIRSPETRPGAPEDKGSWPQTSIPNEIFAPKQDFDPNPSAPWPQGDHTFLANTFPLIDARGAAYGEGSILTDVTESHNLKRRLGDSQKMETIGRLTGGMAHDFNNLLTAVMIYSGLLLAGLPQDSRLRRHAKEIGAAGERGAALIAQLLAFSSEKAMAPKIVNLNSVIAEMQDMLQRLISEEIRIITRPAEDLLTVKLDPGQIHQVILNLATNARDAMPQGGTIEIATKNINVSPGWLLEAPDLAAGRYVMVTVRDSGEGMDQTTESRIFEPFFTTKAPGKGTGLGLSTVFRIVRENGGLIKVKSSLGKGTTFTLFFPATEGEAAQEPAVSPGDAQLTWSTRPHTLLLVEDDDFVRRSIGESLNLVGFEVLTAAGGEEALRISEAHAGPISLMISDLVMPGLNGRELARQISSHRPETKVLLVSGHVDDPRTRDLAAEGMFFFSKPFSPAGLMAKIRAVLEDDLTLTASNSGK